MSAPVVNVAFRPIRRNDGGEWLLVIKTGDLVQQIPLPIDGRSDKGTAVQAARDYLASR